MNNDENRPTPLAGQPAEVVPPQQTPEVEPSTQSMPSGQDEFAPWQNTPQAGAPTAMITSKKRSGWKTALVVAIILVVLGGGGAAAYKFWYQNPEKVVTDGIVNALGAKTLTFKSVLDTQGDTPATLDLTGSAKAGGAAFDATYKVKVEGKAVSISGSAIIAENGDYYVKVKNADEIVKAYLNYSGEELSEDVTAAVDKFVAKINDQWVKISASDIKDYDESTAKTQTCLSDAYKKIQEDKSYLGEVSELYKKHRFLTIKKELGSKDGSLGYEIEGDTAKVKEFIKGLNDTKAVKLLKECDKSITFDDSDLAKDTSSGKVTFQVWVSRWTHQLTKLYVNDPEQKITLTFEPTFDKPVTIAVPEKSKSVKDFMKDIEDLQTAIFSAYFENAMQSESAVTSDEAMFESLSQ